MPECQCRLHVSYQVSSAQPPASICPGSCHNYLKVLVEPITADLTSVTLKQRLLAMHLSADDSDGFIADDEYLEILRQLYPAMNYEI